MTDPKDPSKDDPYATRMRKITNITPEQAAQLSTKQQAIYRNALNWQNGQKKQAAEQASAETAARAQAAAEAKAAKKAEQVAAFRMQTTIPQPTLGGTAKFLWMPQINLSLQSFVFPLAIIIQALARILISARLLPEDHPARNFNTARKYSLVNMINEARPFAGLSGIFL